MTNFYDSLGINGGLNISANTTTDAIYISQLDTLYYTIAPKSTSNRDIRIGFNQSGPDFGVLINTYDNGVATDDILSKTPIEIRVYN